MLVSALSLVACGSKEPEAPATVKFGFAMYTTASAADATEDKNGQGKATSTAAALTVDANGKIVACDIDTADYSVAFTADGKAIANDSFLTKREKGDSYNMVAYGGSKLEWYAQADAFESVVIGKTIDEVKALMVADTTLGTDEVINAGCTIKISDFVLAVEKAYANAKDSAATAADTVKVAFYTAQSTSDATEDKAGSNNLDINAFGAAIAGGKVSAAAIDCVQVKFGFDAKGVSSFDASKALQTKYELGNGYNMKAYGGSALEWFEQADVFAAACIGKTADEIGAMVVEGYGDEALKSAGCTIAIDAMVKAAVKIK